MWRGGWEEVSVMLTEEGAILLVQLRGRRGGEGKRRREKEETSRAREDPVNTGKGRSI